jgi:hypothetical protein
VLRPEVEIACGAHEGLDLRDVVGLVRLALADGLVQTARGQQPGAVLQEDVWPAADDRFIVTVVGQVKDVTGQELARAHGHLNRS